MSRSKISHQRVIINPDGYRGMGVKYYSREKI